MSAQASKKLLNVLKGNQEAVPPIWLMRQAGRYLPEYRALRAEKGGFLALAYDSDAATEITLQPIKRFGFDGAKHPVNYTLSLGTGSVTPLQMAGVSLGVVSVALIAWPQGGRV